MAGNWKMNLNHLEAVAHVQRMAFALTDEDYEACEVLVSPAVHRPAFGPGTGGCRQDQDQVRIPGRLGARLGCLHREVSGSMLSKLGCSYAVVGHSERRVPPRGQRDREREGARGTAPRPHPDHRVR